jgi:DnaJ-domain-containing protein 1
VVFLCWGVVDEEAPLNASVRAIRAKLKTRLARGKTPSKSTTPQPVHSFSIHNSSKMPRKREIDLEDEEPPAIEPYKVLGIEKSATADKVKSAYRKAALKHHPGMRYIILLSDWLEIEFAN